MQCINEILTNTLSYRKGKLHTDSHPWAPFAPCLQSHTSVCSFQQVTKSISRLRPLRGWNFKERALSAKIIIFIRLDNREKRTPGCGHRVGGVYVNWNRHWNRSAGLYRRNGYLYTPCLEKKRREAKKIREKILTYEKKFVTLQRFWEATASRMLNGECSSVG